MKRPVSKQKHLIAAHFNPRELKTLDVLQGHVEKNPRTGRKSYRALDQKLRDPHVLRRVEGHLFEHTRRHGRMKRIDPKNGRNGDTTIAYIGPVLRRLLDMAAGRITRNPHDNHPEYFDLTGTLGSLGSGLTGAVGNIGSTVGNVVGGLGSTVGNLVNGLGNTVANTVTHLPDTLANFGNSIIGGIDNIGSDIFGGGTVSPQKFLSNIIDHIGPTWTPPPAGESWMLNTTMGVSPDQLHQAWADLHPPTPMASTHANNFLGLGLGGIALPGLTPQAVDPFTGKPVASSSSSTSSGASSQTSAPPANGATAQSWGSPLSAQMSNQAYNMQQQPSISPAQYYGDSGGQSPYSYNPYQSYPSYSQSPYGSTPYNVAPSYSPYYQMDSYQPMNNYPSPEEEGAYPPYASYYSY